MTKPYIVRRDHAHCPTRKVCYDSKIEALLELRGIQKKPNDKRKERRAYECHICHKWHLTSQELKDA